ncbi:hypothetical protein KAFR_0G01320 [Kazachstania africana CBS 2517]|uniref:Vacuolar protein sorting-associated protein 52 n=1 Tax=Kazachstania africana (strain ATCC 22294 / BCRC 22015 / CBS 2517 / CECT 1963 / NBRC 1671 / NRRL Y-8276) TaxID=1071382 RepID=H2AXR6_KAZAF|nr:hypothetical protein KAFR_0G01320 [Kazachstania africana CBS 2517]CCF59166.1 hypothetical protein KAFR_0G01320 [Kazachstania africana CBS 2517]
METLNNILGTTVPLGKDNKNTQNTSEQPYTVESDCFSDFISDHNNWVKANPNLSNVTHLKEELGKFENRHKDIQATLVNVIPPLKDSLQTFSEQLSAFTNELGFIRNKSSELKALLDDNSQKLADISPMVNDLIIPPKIVDEIVHGKINSNWQDNITFIKDKQEIYSRYKNQQNVQNSKLLMLPKDFQLLSNILDVLKSIILERSKKFIVSRIKLLRSSPPISSQRIQKQLLQVNEIFKFIIENNYSLALEIRQAYAYTMRWYYKEYFGRYIRSLTILQFKQIDNQYSLGNVLINSTNKNNSSSLFTSYLSTGYISTVDNEAIKEYFQIKKRLSILTQEDNTVMVSQIAENNNSRDNFIETGFKNLNLAILDNCTAEYNFTRKFFQISNNTEEINGLLEQIFEPTFKNALNYTQQILINQYVYDIFGVLISIRIANQLEIESGRRSIPVVESYLNDQLILLWPKFQQLVSWQSDSLSKVSNSQLLKITEDEMVRPHELTIFFATFLESLLTLTTHVSTEQVDKEVIQDEKSEPLYNSIIRLRNDFETIMTRSSKQAVSPEKFLSVNYLYVLNSLQQQTLSLDRNDLDSNKNFEQSIIKETQDHFMTLVEAFNQSPN